MSMLISAFLALIIGVSLVGVIATEGNTMTNTITITDEEVSIIPAILADGVINTSTELTIANAPSGWRTTGCPITSFVLGNASEDYTLTTDYTFTAASGVITLKDTAEVNYTVFADNITLVDYAYCDDTYLTQGWNRTIIDLVPGFFALALMGIGVGLFYSVMRNEGIIGK